MANTHMDNLIKEARQLGDSLLQQMTELSTLLAEEAALVGRNQLDNLPHFVRRKNDLINGYQATLKSLTTRPELLQALPDDMRVKLRASGEKLGHATTSNALLLKGAVQATARVVQNIFAIIREEALPKQGYVNTKQAHINTTHYSPTAPAIIVNRTA